MYIWNNVLHEFSLFQLKQLRKLVGVLPFGDIFDLSLRISLVIIITL